MRLTVIQDTREQTPLRMPANVRLWQGREPVVAKVNVEEKLLVGGDYAIKGWEALARVERKGSLEELWTNLFDKTDSHRFQRSLDKMQTNSRHSALFLDFPVQYDTLINGEPAEEVIQRVFEISASRSLPVLWVPPGRTPKTVTNSGDVLVRWLFGTCFVAIREMQTAPAVGASRE